MSRLPQVTPRKMIAALQRAGFVISGTKGGHYYLEHRDDPTRWTTVSVHPGDLRGGTVRAILKQTGLSREEFLKLLSIRQLAGSAPKISIIGEARGNVGISGPPSI